jgi:hypothetical protein
MEFVEPDAAKGGDEMSPDYGLMADEGRRPDMGFNSVLEPLSEELSDGLPVRVDVEPVLLISDGRDELLGDFATSSAIERLSASPAGAPSEADGPGP